jgi:endonuclease/exonuclease/phosphatase (EEP) superfamily protein YafD
VFRRLDNHFWVGSPAVQHLGATLDRMPTRYRRVSVTLTPPLEEARRRLRDRGVDVSVGELALAGAHAMLREVDDDEQDERRRRALREQLVADLRNGDLMDPAVLLDIHEHGWTRA